MRTISHDTHTGPGTLRLRLPVGSVTLVADSATARASVTLAPTTPGDQDAIDAINRATVQQTGAQLSITVPAPASGSATGFAQTVVHSGSGDIYVSQRGAVVTGSVTGVTITGDGTIVVGSGSGRVVSGSDGVRAELRVPAGQRVEIDSDATDVSADGPLAAVHADVRAGNLRIDQADNVDLSTGSGGIALGRVGSAQVRSGSGRVRVGQIHTGSVRTGSGGITVDAVTGPLSLKTGSGSVRAHLAAAVSLQATTGSGDIQVTAEPGITVDRSGLRTGSGRIR